MTHYFTSRQLMRGLPMLASSLVLAACAINPADAQLLEEMILTAANQALGSAREIANTEMGKITSGLSIPGLG